MASEPGIEIADRLSFAGSNGLLSLGLQWRVDPNSSW